MKKYLALVLGTLFVLGFAAPSFAIHASIPAETAPVVSPLGIHTQIGGEIRVRGWFSDNITTATAPWGNAITGRPYASGEMGWYDQRVRLFVNSRIGANVSGRIHLETASYEWGAVDTAVHGSGGRAIRGAQADAFRILEAWVAYTGKGLLGVPSGIRLGHMPLVVGEGTFFDHRIGGADAILLWVEPARGTDINFATAKLFEGPVTLIGGVPAVTGVADNTDDIDLYSLMLTHRLDKDNTIGVNYSLVNHRDNRQSLQNIGLLARGRVADIGYKATVDFQFGRIGGAGTPLPKENYRGWGLTLGANYRIDPVTLRANFIYGSGDDNPADDRETAFHTLVGTGIDPNLPTVVYNWRVHSAAGALGTGIANTTAYNIGITTSPIRDLTLHLDYYLLKASERLAPVGSGLFGSDKNIGSEVTLRTTYRIARNLTYAINAGVLFASDFYKVGTVGIPSNPENAMVFQHQIVFAF